MKLDLLPMPPTDNLMYTSIRGRRVKSQANHYFSKDMFAYAVEHQMKLTPIRMAIKKALEERKRLHIKIILHFQADRIFTKDGRLKRLDATNRLKALCDELAKILCCDDKEFVSVAVMKRASESTRESVSVRIKIRS